MKSLDIEIVFVYAEMYCDGRCFHVKLYFFVFFFVNIQGKLNFPEGNALQTFLSVEYSNISLPFTNPSDYLKNLHEALNSFQH